MKAAIAWIVMVAALACTAPAAEQPSVYHDAKERFSIMVPAGWKARGMGDSVQIVREDSYVSVLVFDHTDDVNALLDQLSQQMGKKWKRFEPAGRGDLRLAGNKASIASFKGVNAEGAEAELKLSGILVHTTAFVLVRGALLRDLPKVSQTLDEIEETFALGKENVEAAPASATIGVEVTDLNPEDAAAYKLENVTGAMVLNLKENGAAKQAGVQIHDVITNAGGQTVDSAAMLQQVVKSHKPGDALELQILRMDDAGKPAAVTVQVTLGAQ